MELDYENAIEVRNLSKKYKNFKLNNVNFDVPKGRIVGFIGANGSGKSTTINSILNIIEINSGEIQILGTNYNRNPQYINENVGVVFDDFSFHEMLTVVDMDKIFKSIYKKWDSAIYNTYIKNFKLPKNQKIGTLSKGMKMKLSVIMALSQKPKLLVMDEATTGLDVGARHDVLDILLEFIQDEEHTVFFSSHIVNDLERIADHILLIHKGEVIISDDKDNMLENYGILKCRKSEFEDIISEDIVEYRSNKVNYECLVSNKKQMQKKYKEMIIDNATLDDILLFYIKGEQNEGNSLQRL